MSRFITISCCFFLLISSLFTVSVSAVAEDIVIDGFSVAVNSDGLPFNDGVGWISGYRLNSQGVQVEASGRDCSGFIPIQLGDIILVTGLEAGSVQCYFHYYDSDFNWIGSANSDVISGSYPNYKFEVSNSSACYFRFTAVFVSATCTISRTVDVPETVPPVTDPPVTTPALDTTADPSGIMGLLTVSVAACSNWFVALIDGTGFGGMFLSVFFLVLSYKFVLKPVFGHGGSDKAKKKSKEDK